MFKNIVCDSRVPVRVGVLILATLLAACGGSGSSSPAPSMTPTPTPTPSASELTSMLVKPVISGLRYQTLTQDGETSAQGSFVHLEGEDVVFAIGDIEFPAFPAAESAYMFDLATTHIVTRTRFLNVSRLLYSLDMDADPSNGIHISSATHAMAAGMSLDFESVTFADDVANLVANSGSVNTVLLSEVQARDYILEELDTDGSCLRTSDKVGQVADLSTAAHGVEGQLRVLNDCTIEATNFSFDGGGAGDVRFYDVDAGVAFGDNLYGQIFNSETTTFTLGVEQLDVLSRISVWCIPVGASFGSGVFE